MTALVISNKEMKDIIKIVECLKESDLLIKGVTKAIEKKRTKLRFLGVLLDTLGASLLRNMLAGKRVIRASKVTITAGHDF